MGTPTHVVMGRIGRSHGVKGWMKVQSFTEPMAQLLAYQPWYLDEDPIHLAESREAHDHLLVKIEGCNDPETVLERYTNRMVTLRREQLPATEEDEHYWQDLIGCQVHTEDGTHLGKVHRLLRTPGNDVLVVKAKGRKHMVPWTHDAVKQIDVSQQHIVVVWDKDF